MKVPSSSFLATAFLLVASLAFAGCASTIANTPVQPLPQAMTVDPPPGSTMLTANTFAGDALAAMLLQRIDGSNGILVAAFVDMEDTNQSSPFGRTSMQQVASRLGQHGFRVTEMRMGDGMRINPAQGELILTRDAARLMTQQHNAHAVLVGMYSQTDRNVFVSVRVVRLSDNAVIAAYEYFVPYTDDARALLGSGGKSNADVWDRFAHRGAAFPAPKPAAASAGSTASRPAARKSSARRAGVKRASSTATAAARPAPVQEVVDPCPEELQRVFGNPAKGIPPPAK